MGFDTESCDVLPRRVRDSSRRRWRGTEARFTTSVNAARTGVAHECVRHVQLPGLVRFMPGLNSLKRSLLPANAKGSGAHALPERAVAIRLP